MLFLHSFNVCVISVIIGMKMGLDRSKLKELAIGTLFHDIGKISVADHRQEEYNEEHHTWKGFNLLRKNPEISKLSLGIILQHHEYIDGSGAPRGIKGDEIHLLRNERNKSCQGNNGFH
ncbi:HD-GYP domain-containing protein [Peribacillus tepidiphilus]|uniref:HD-GYP domain-containing protein n=1 Tax=Peribacillus tepidiphilus TaxID=2652445 RepID=UPI0035B54151